VFTETLYRWSVPACPVNILLDVALADRLRTAATASDVEIGGLLLGHFQDNQTIVTDFELVESEHRRGTAYSLSRRDDQVLTAKLTAFRKRKNQVVGFFRSHLRPGMFLDAADDSTLRDHFSNPQQVALLVKPSDDGTATGGFFFWEEGEMNRRETFLAFPMNSEELGTGPAFDAAQTLDELPRKLTVAPVVDVGAPASNLKPSGNWVQTSWLKIGIVAAAAALGGYYLGTSGSREHFGSRPGDFTINDVAEAPAPVAAAARVAPGAPAVSTAQLEKAVVPDPAPAKQEPAKPVLAKPVLAKPVLNAQPERITIATARSKPISKPLPQHAVFEDMVRNSPPAAGATPPEAEAPAPAPPPATEPTLDRNAGAFPHNPNPLPPPSEVAQAGNATVDLEAVEDGGIKHALHRLPLFGALGGTYRGGQDFHPPQVLRRTAPKVPPDVARELTSEVVVALKLKVDSTGRVSSVELVSHGSDRALVRLAGDAAYEWQFQPALMKDRPVSSEVIAHFRFRPL
jgi:outer membrane biosynthesis protein TonB